jgi:hypothetical protein
VSAAPAGPEALDAPLTPAEFARLRSVSTRLPLAWTSTRRRRRLLFLGMSAPGFIAVFATPLHHSFALLILGPAAGLFRQRTEPVFARAEAAEVWPPLSPSRL